MYLSMSSQQRGKGGGRRRGIGRAFDQSLWLGGRAFQSSCCPGVGMFEFFSCTSSATNHFPLWGISVIFDLTFLPGGREFYSIFFGKCQIHALCI